MRARWDLNPRSPAPKEKTYGSLDSLCFDGVHCGEYDDIIKDFHDFLVVEMRLEERTVEGHCWNIKQFLKAIGKDIHEISRLDIRNFFLGLMKEKSQATINNYLKTLKRFFRDYLHRPELIESFKFKRAEYNEKRIPSKEDLKRFYEALPNIEHKAVFLTLASSGLRAREVLSLTRKDIDLEHRRLYPSKHSTSTKKVGIGFFNEETAKVLKEILKGKHWKEDEKIFPALRTLDKRWAKVSEQSGVKITPQILREWFCSEMGRLGVPDRYIDAFCGRVPKSILAKHYTDYNPETLKEIYDKANLKVLS
uniref:Site-specific integrase n=1 Tax=Caldisericum exile TaxID=693075 RepID=A0A7C4U0H6_9BACT